MAGLLDWIDTPEGIGLLSAVAGGLAGARKGTPWNNVGRAGVAGVIGYQNEKDNQRQLANTAIADKFRTMQMNEIEQRLAQQAAQQKWKAGLPDVLKNRTKSVAPNADTQLMAESMGSQAAPEVVDNSQAMNDYLMQPDSPYAEKLMERQLFPAAADYKVIGGSLVKIGPDGATPVYTAPEKVDYNKPFLPDGTPNPAYQQYELERSRAGAPQTVTYGQPQVFTRQDGTPVAVQFGNKPGSEPQMTPLPGLTDRKPVAPMSATVQKELIESDDITQASRTVINILDQALDINDKAYSGYGAKPRAVLRSNLPGVSQEADNTINLDNMMTGQALESLKLIFGGMPTEGERKILLDMQASADKTPEQRKAIILRAKDAAARRGAYAQGKASAIRGGTYLDEGFKPEPMQVDLSKKEADYIAKRRAAGATDAQIASELQRGMAGSNTKAKPTGKAKFLGFE